ncbi:MAG: type II toxin-antitoxin system HicA family toxin [Synechococcales bacterium]|nr:type II toxin-antitoxin system HicA family toxin [Synechococcales bacterium]
MQDSKRIKLYAQQLGWELHRTTGKHEIWRSPSGKTMPLPSTPGGGRWLQNVQAKLRRYA